MVNQVNPPRGMRDYLPGQKAVRERLLGEIRDVYTMAGFDEVETPAMEEQGILTGGAGGDNEKMMFMLLRRRLKPTDWQAADAVTDLSDMGLRYDLTVPLMRFYATHGATLPRVSKVFQIGNVWRGERPQRGRYRQFIQCDMDIIGDATALAEGELLSTVDTALTRLGVPTYEVHISDRRLLNHLLTQLGIPVTMWLPTLIAIDKLDKIGWSGVVQELTVQGWGESQLADLAQFLEAGRADLERLGELGYPVEGLRDISGMLDTRVGQKLVFNPSLVRGMGYYTGPIYELRLPGTATSIGGGGRYDDLLHDAAGQPISAVGLSLGFDRLVDALPTQAGQDPASLALIYNPALPAAYLLTLRQRFLQAGYRVLLVRQERNITHLLDELAARGFSRFAMLRDVSTEPVLKPLEVLR